MEIDNLSGGMSNNKGLKFSKNVLKRGKSWSDIIMQKFKKLQDDNHSHSFPHPATTKHGRKLIFFISQAYFKDAW